MRPDPKPANPTEAGFSLLEVVVAIAVFSLGALAVMNVLGEDARAAEANERRTVAAIVAENRLTEAMAPAQAPAIGVSSGMETSLSRQWEWQVRIAASPDPRMVRIDVAVREAGQQQLLAELSSFRAAR
jgi:general secretion pathway protein I